jgi:hypothetical protein
MIKIGGVHRWLSEPYKESELSTLTVPELVYVAMHRRSQSRPFKKALIEYLCKVHGERSEKINTAIPVGPCAYCGRPAPRNKLWCNLKCQCDWEELRRYQRKIRGKT